MNITKDLSAKQATILRYLKNTIAEAGRPPTIREIGRHFGFKSTGTTRDHLRSLARKGYIRLKHRQSRAIELSKPLVFKVPLLGRITAGMPDLAFQETDDYLHLDEFLPSQDRQIFALKIKGDSMDAKGISQGDIAVVRRQRLATAGDVIAALVDNEATIKILKKRGSGFFLAPANEAYPEIHKPFEILGRVIAVIKRF